MFDTMDAEEAHSIASFMRPARRARAFLPFCHTMRLPDGPHQGEFFRPETEPSQAHFARAVTSGVWTRFVYIAPSQRGKTTIGVLAPWMYGIAEENVSVGYVMPNLDKLSQNWEGKIKPAIVGSGFGSWLPQHGPGSKGGRPAALTMTNPANGRSSVSYFMAGGTGSRETSLSSVSPATLVVDEVDDFENAGQVELALRRLESWGRRGKAFLASTVNSRGDREDHPILDFFSRSDATQSRIEHKCPHCGEFQVIVFEQLSLETGKIACSKCGVSWSDNDRALALDNSRIKHTNEGKTQYFSLLTTCFDYHMGDFSAIVPSFLAARDKEKLGDYSMMETFQQKVLCQPYTIPVDHETVTDRMLSLRSAQSTYEKGVCPDDCDRIVVGVDVQGDRCYWVAVGSGSRDRRWIIDYDEWFWSARDERTGKPVEPTDADRHAVLDRVVARARDGWPQANGNVVRASLVAIDIGFNPNGSIGRFVFGKAGIVAVRGDHEGRVVAESLQGKQTVNFGKGSSILVSDHGMYEIRKQDFQPGQPGNWWFIKSQSMREHVTARLRLPMDSDGSLNIPRGIAERDYLIQHLSAWAIVREPDSKVVRWVQIRKRDDYADATNYAIALLSHGRRQTKAGGTIQTTKE